MAFGYPQKEKEGVPSLGYRLSSNRQPGIEQSNNMMPQEGMRPRFNPRDMPQPQPQYERPIGRPGMGNYQNMGMQINPREEYIANTQGGHPNMSQFGYPMPNSEMSGGIMGAMPPERQMAELSQPQLDFMGSPYGRPDFFSSYQDYKNAVDSYEDKGFLGGIFGGGQEPATDPEIIKQLKETYGTIPFQVPGIV